MKERIKYPRPAWVTKRLKELRNQTGKKLQVKYVNGSWHVHEYRTWWDPQKKKPFKISKYIGTIHPNGFYKKTRSKKRKKEVEERKDEGMMRYERSHEYGASRFATRHYSV